MNLSSRPSMFFFKDKPKYKPKDKAKALSKAPNEGSESFAPSTGLAPFTIEEEAERARIVNEAQKIKQQDDLRKRHTNCVTAEEALGFLDRINTLGSENKGLDSKVVDLENIVFDLRNELDAYQQTMERVEQKMRKKEAEYQQEKNHLHTQVTDAINLREAMKCDMEAYHHGVVNTLRKDHDKEMQKLTERHNTKVSELGDELLRMESMFLTNVGRFLPMSNSAFQKRFTDLKKLVENVARNLPEVEGDVMGRTFTETSFVQAAEFVKIAHKKHWRFLLEGTFWNIVMQGLFATPFSIFGAYGDDYLDYWRDLFEKQRDKPEPGSEQWRSVTFETLLQQIEVRPKLRQSCEINLKKISEELTAVLRNFSQHRPDDIRNIVSQAHRLALDIGIQRSRVLLFAPPLGATVKRNTRTYDDVNNSNANDVAKGVVRLVASPGLRVFGDARGYSFNEEPVELWPAAVYLTAL